MVTANRSTLSGLVAGLILGVPLGIGVGFGVVRQASARREATWATVPVLVTSRELLAGHLLTAADLVEGAWPQELVTESCATPESRGRFVGQTLRWRVAPDTVVRDTDLVKPERACAARVDHALAAMDGGTPALTQLGAALVERHGGRP